MDKTLEIRFHGRVIEHLGIDMYQSPVAAVAELISNAWDADADSVEVQLPSDRKSTSILSIIDDGLGMTFDECQTRFLRVGYNRRAKGKNKTPSGRKVMGRKGIGKFAGFGIAQVVEIDTTSASTGERTHFRLDLGRLLSVDEEDESDEYVSSKPLAVEVVAYEGPNDERKTKHGTNLTLRKLTLGKRIGQTRFLASMARFRISGEGYWIFRHGQRPSTT